MPTQTSFVTPNHPDQKTELRSFFGLCDVYCRFIQDFANKAAPLGYMLKKETPDNLTWDEEQAKGFQELIESIYNPPNLHFPSCAYRNRLTVTPVYTAKDAPSSKPVKMKNKN